MFMVTVTTTLLIVSERDTGYSTCPGRLSWGGSLDPSARIHHVAFHLGDGSVLSAPAL